MLEPPMVASPIPPALQRSPRLVRRKRGTLGPLLLGRIATAPVLAVAAATIGLAVLDLFVAVLIPAQPARIIRQWRETKTRRGTACYVEYQFDRSGFIGHDEVLPAEFDALPVGQMVNAHLLHIGPLGYSVLDRPLAAYARRRTILWLGASFALAIGGVLFHAFWLMPWRLRRLAQNGTATFGAVVEKSIYRGGRRHIHFSLTYQFKALGVLHARCVRISPQRYDSSALKDLVIVLYDPAKPNRSIVYDYCDFIAA